MLYGVIDIGSNTIRFMIYRVDNGAIHPVLNNKFAAGLAGYITGQGKMSKEGIRKAVEVLTELRTVTEQITLDGVFPSWHGSPAEHHQHPGGPGRHPGGERLCGAGPFRRGGSGIRLLRRPSEYTFGRRTAGGRGRRQHGAGVLHQTEGGAGSLAAVGSLTLYNRFVDGILPSRGEVRKIEAEAAAQIGAAGCTSAAAPPSRSWRWAAPPGLR